MRDVPRLSVEYSLQRRQLNKARTLSWAHVLMMLLLPARHCERAVAKRRRCEGCQVATAVPTASVSVEIDREEITFRARCASGCATRNDFWREAVGSERARLRETPNHFAKVPTALAVRLLAVVYVLEDVRTDARIAAVSGRGIYDGL